MSSDARPGKVDHSFRPVTLSMWGLKDAANCQTMEEARERLKCETLLPYADADVDMSRDPMSRANWDKSEDVDEELLDKFVHRVALAGHMTDGDEGYGITSIDDIEVTEPDYLSRVRPKKAERPHLTRQFGRRKKKKEDDKKKGRKNLPEGSRVEEDYFTCSVTNFRNYIRAELDDRARMIHSFYEYQWHEMATDRMKMLRELVVCQDYCRRLQKEKDAAEREIATYRRTTESLQTRLNDNKESKRRRRQIKKQHKKADQSKSSQSLGEMSRDEGGSGDTAIGTTTDDNTVLSD